MSCDLCRGLRGHGLLTKLLFDELNSEYKQAVREAKRLQSLYNDVCWYNFETTCRHWGGPWHASVDGSLIELYGHVCFPKGSCEFTEFPVWYSGSVGTAPKLPVEIVAKELRDAKERVRVLKEERNAPYDFAPGGRKYEQLRRHGVGVSAYRALQSSNKIA